MKKTSQSLLFLVMIVFFSLNFLYFGRDFPTRFKFIPYLVTLFVLFLSFIQILLETIPALKEAEIGKSDLFHIGKYTCKNKELSERKRESGHDRNKEKKLWEILGWNILLISGIYLLGFLIALPIFIFLFYLIQCGYQWMKELSITFLFWLVHYIVFELFLRVELYRGIILIAMR